VAQTWASTPIIRVLGYQESAIEIDTLGAGSTGCHFSNIYLANNLAGGQGPQNTANRGLVLRQFTNSTFDQLNLEHGGFTNEPIALTDVETTTFTALHLEGVQPQRFGSGIVRLFGDTQVNFISVDAIFNDLSFNAQHGLFEIDDNNYLFATGVRAKGNTGAATANLVTTVNAAGAPNSEVEIRDYHGDIQRDYQGVQPDVIKRLNAWQTLDMEPQGGGTVHRVTVDGGGRLLIDGTVVGTQV